MLLLKGCRAWTFSSLLSREEILGKGPPSQYALHLILHELLQASPELTETLLLWLCCKARAQTTLHPKRMAVFHPALLKWSYNSINLGTLPPYSLCLPAFLSYASYEVFQSKSIPISQSSIFSFSISNSCLWEQKLCSLVNQTEMNTCV